MGENLDLNAFNSLTERQRNFLFEQMTDPETGTRYFQIERDRAMQFWFEQLVLTGWVSGRKPSDTKGMFDCEIPMSLWPVIAEAKTAA